MNRYDWIKGITGAIVLSALCSFAYADKQVSFDNVDAVSMKLVIEEYGEVGKYRLVLQTQGKATTDGIEQNYKDKQVLMDGNTYTLKQIYTNWETPSGIMKTALKEAVLSLINESVE